MSLTCLDLSRAFSFRGVGTLRLSIQRSRKNFLLILLILQFAATVLLSTDTECQQKAIVPQLMFDASGQRCWKVMRHFLLALLFVSLFMTSPYLDIQYDLVLQTATYKFTDWVDGMVLISALSYQWIAGISSDSFYCWCVGGMLLIDAFHSSVIKLQSQNSGVLQILIYTRLKINKKINLCTSFLPRSMFRFESRAFSQCMRDTNFKQNYCFIEKSLFSSLDFQQSTVKPRGASLQRIPGNKVLAWDQARSDQAPHWGNKGKKKSA